MKKGTGKVQRQVQRTDIGSCAIQLEASVGTCFGKTPRVKIIALPSMGKPNQKTARTPNLYANTGNRGG